ncbi:hypothetical protein POI8812_03317 [Pontivivens insulae]|uniref:YgjP-like metallopeptidase domain-containing protein n=1 Tax=Pontivivens insulae TaxID=1639689 RepID=A0A2R8AFX1_9RHOB|nr:hypothetical protein POI8812_03317 [Pontivivens insulae]
MLTAPLHVREHLLTDFLEERTDWLQQAMERIPQPRGIRDGMVLPVDGQDMRVALTRRRGIRVEGQCLELPQSRPGPAALGWLKTVARDRIITLADHYARRVGRPHTGLTLRDPRSRWGSCSSDGRLMLSWRLILAPPAVCDYVVAHEAAHLIEMNHGQDFWRLTEELCPDWRSHRDWLRTNGSELHQWRFD